MLALLAAALGGLPATAAPGSKVPGDIVTVAGTGIADFSGDGGLAIKAQLDSPSGVAVDAAGNLFIADTGNHRIRRVDGATGIITTVAGTGTQGFTGDNGEATSARLSVPFGVAVDGNGNLFIADTGNHRVRRVDAVTGIITTVAGTGTEGFNGDGILATSAHLNQPRSVAVREDDGWVFISDTGNHRVRVVLPFTGFISTVAGNGVAAYAGDGGPGPEASLNGPRQVAVDTDGNLFIADRANQRVRRVDGDTITITTVAGNGLAGFLGDGEPATSARLNNPIGVAVDGVGNLYIGDTSNRRVRRVEADTQIITTWAGNGELSPIGDGWAATGAAVVPNHLAVDHFGNLFIGSTSQHRVQMVEEWELEVIRLAGANRFETAAVVAATHYPSGSDWVAVATGWNFPDALAGAAAAGKGLPSPNVAARAPLLLTGSVPPATADALIALAPELIVILGGPAAVSDDTAAELAAFATLGAGRLHGSNRYDTAVEISKISFEAGTADAVVVATGENFPDALAGAPAAVRLGGPVLLTPRDEVPLSVIAEIGRLDPTRIFVLGGQAVVSQQVVETLDGLNPTTRISGQDRYETAVAISQHVFLDPAAVNRVYVAVGTNFPDALSGAAVAAARGAPVLLSPSDTLPQIVIDEILRLAPARIYILGGTAVISPEVESELAALLGP